MGNQGRHEALLTRRAFVGLVGKGAAVVAVGGVIRLLEPPGTFIRPHAYVPDAEFLSLCIRCDKCREVCPWNYITIVPITKSIIYAGTPSLETPCTRCWRCVLVCPTGALRA